MNRERLYWILQILGWGGFAFVIIFLASLSSGVSAVQVWAFVVLAMFNLVSTHFLRYIVKTYNWFKLSIPLLLFQSLLAILALSFVNVIAQILINIVFNTLNPTEDFRILVILANLFQAFLFYVMWFLLYFLFHFLDNYNTS